MTHRPRKRLSQNFLRDQTILAKLLSAINPKPDQHFVEIGAGLGALTCKLLPLVKHLDAIEIDRTLIAPLAENCKNLGSLMIHEADALKINLGALQQQQQPMRIVGNLPYHISTPLLFHILHYAHQITDIHFMLQKEVVDRLAATPGSKTYGRLSIMVQYQCEVYSLFHVPPHAFYPQPKVNSAIVKIIPRTIPPYLAKDPVTFSNIVRAAFNQRRKTLRNSLRDYKLTPNSWESLKIDPNDRPEQLTVEDFVKISNIVSL